MIAVSFAAFLLMFLGVGVAAVRRGTGTRDDYYIASQGVSPALVGLSAVATNNSGYMFIGVIGYTYATGLPAIWLMFGWILGDFLASLFVHRRIQETTKRLGTVSFGGLLGQWHGTSYNSLRRLVALISIVFLGAYASAQLAAGGKALNALFGWPLETGAILGAGIVIAYCLAGGIRASIWTDAAQSAVMIVSMTLLFVMAVQGLGGPGSTWEQLSAIPGYTDWFPGDLLVPGAAGMMLFVVGWMFAGFSVIGQPHIMVRFMALDNPANITRARLHYYGFFIVFYFLANGVGLLSRLYLPDLQSLDPELALPTMALELLPAALVGLVLAGIFAATMSTADSLVLSCSAALTHDLLPHGYETSRIIKAGTFGVTLLALLMALSGNQSVFSLVILAWSVLASAFGPLIVVYALGGRPSERLAITMVGTGIATALFWRYLGLHNDIYEGMPGILAGLLVYVMGLALGPRRGTAAATVSGEPA